MSLSIISLNARGLRNNVKRKAIFLFCKQFNSDFCFIQESHSTEQDKSFWRSQWGNDVWMSHGTERAAGVCILKNRFNGKVLLSDSDKDGHYIFMILEVAHSFFILVNVYGFNSRTENNLLFNRLETRLLHWLSKYPKSFIIFGGDFNTVFDNSMDRWPPRSPDSNSPIKLFAQNLDLIDSWRDSHPNQRAYTWCNKSQTRHSRIDFWLTSKDLKNVKTDIHATPLSDHKTIHLTVPLSSSSGTKASYWKLNGTILEHLEVISETHRLIKLYWNKALAEHSFCNNWELLKYELGKFFRKYSSDLTKKRRAVETDVIQKIALLTSKPTDVLDETDKTALIDLQHKLDDIYKRKAEGAFIRSRRRWIEEGEQNSAYFFRLEKYQSNSNSVSQLNINGVISDDRSTIAKYCSDFYSKLYSSNYCSTSALTFLNTVNNITPVSEADRVCCDDVISLNEVTDAIKYLKINKSPGKDGLTAEFYKQFSDNLAPFLLKVFEESINKGALPPTLSQGLITLIPKPRKDPLSLDNWRPITLLNCDYKILALILANRIKPVLDTIIDENQSGFMQNRHISNNIRLILDILDYSELVQDDSLILFLDFYKAFDSLEHNFIIAALNKFGFGQFFCNAVQTLYVNSNSSIKLASGTSPRFFLKRGVRQGCPLSVYLFLLSVQLLNLHIKLSPLKGLIVAEREIFISQLADDTALFLRDASQVAVAINIIQSFSKASGLTLNLNKCEILPVKNCLLTSIQGIPVKTSVTYLGIQITKDMQSRCSTNFSPIIDKTKKTLNQWLQRDLSLKGRVLLTKAEGISRLTYAAQSLQVNNTVCNTINRILYNFLWRNKTHYIRKSVILNTSDKGGLNCIDFTALNNTLKVIWIKKYLNNPTSIWNFIPHFVFSKVGGLNFLLCCNYSIPKIPLKLSNFHQQVLLAWTLIYKHNFSPQSCIIWNNCNIVYKRKTLFLSNWFNNGIIFLNQLFKEPGLLYNYSEFTMQYKIPITPKEFVVVFDAVPSGLCMLFRGFYSAHPLTLHPPDVLKSPLGSFCFTSAKQLNSKIRALFQDNLVSVPSAIFYWANFTSNIDWKKVWSLPQKYFLTNKVKEISFKLLHRFYPAKHYLTKFKADINTSCTFCQKQPETCSHLFWSCEFTYRFWKNIHKFITDSIFADIQLYYKNILFGFHSFDVKDRDAFFCVNMVLFIAKFHIHKRKFSNKKPDFFVFKLELQRYLNLISASKNTKAQKTISICKSFGLLT
uniref:Reverse transcriptase domain-containing protein n=1 Tax=Oryzias latipes TaxID=8090 RepID=A0A3B3I0R1_ORYLA